jgi:hypothetical protein
VPSRPKSVKETKRAEGTTARIRGGGLAVTLSKAALLRFYGAKGSGEWPAYAAGFLGPSVATAAAKTAPTGDVIGDAATAGPNRQELY